MKKMIPFFLGFFILFSCSQNIKQQNNSKTDTLFKTTITILNAADSAKKADSTTKLITALASDTIFAGEKIAQLILNHSFEEALQIMGDPATADTSKKILLLQWKMNKIDTIQYYTTVLFNGSKVDKKITQISTSSPSFRTSNQVSCGSTLAYIKIQFPTIKKASDTFSNKEGKTISIYDEVKEGIAFEIDEGGRCILVSVHVKGQKYIKLPL